MKRSELEKVLLDEIVRTRAQLVRLQMVLARRTEERKSRMDQCEECDRLWKEYQRATIQSAQLYEEIRSMTEDRGLRKLRETTIKAEAAERLFEEARQSWQNIRQQPAIVDISKYPQSALPINRPVRLPENDLRNGVAVERPPAQRLKDHHVERATEDVQR